jgi:hypothetical protein
MAEPVRLRFSRSLYAPASIARAAERFAAFGPSIVDAEADVLVLFSEVPERLRDRLPDEFSNHALFQTIVDAREQAPQ